MSAPYGEASDVYRAMGRPEDALDLLRTEVEISGDSVALADFPRASTDSQAERVFQQWARLTLLELKDRKRAGEEIGPGAWANGLRRSPGQGQYPAVVRLDVGSPRP